MNSREFKHNIKMIFHKINLFSVIKYNIYKKRAMSKFNYNNSNITILSPNCIAGEIYHILGLKFLSPTINTSINRRDFLMFCEHLAEYINVDAKFKKYRNTYTPVLSIKPDNLPEIEIAFPHDYDEKICIKNWNKRKNRIIKNKIYIICDDQNMIEGDIERFEALNCKNKILFTSNKKLSTPSSIYIGKEKILKKYQYKGMDGIYKFQHFFDFPKFLNS